MLEADEAQEAFDSAQEHLKMLQGRQIEKNARLRGEKSELEKEVARLETEQKAAAESIASKDLEIYEKLRKTRKGLAVARVSHQSCNACGSTLSSSMMQAARSPKTLTFCETCKRILYTG